MGKKKFMESIKRREYRNKRKLRNNKNVEFRDVRY